MRTEPSGRTEEGMWRSPVAEVAIPARETAGVVSTEGMVAVAELQGRTRQSLAGSGSNCGRTARDAERQLGCRIMFRRSVEVQVSGRASPCARSQLGLVCWREKFRLGGRTLKLQQAESATGQSQLPKCRDRPSDSLAATSPPRLTLSSTTTSVSAASRAP